MYAGGYTIAAEAFNTTGVLNGLGPGMNTVLAPSNSAFSYGRLPYKLIIQLAQPVTGLQALTSIMEYHVLETYKSYAQFVSAGNAVYPTILDDTEVGANVTGSKVTFYPIPFTAPRRRPLLVTKDLHPHPLHLSAGGEQRPHPAPGVLRPSPRWHTQPPREFPAPSLRAPLPRRPPRPPACLPGLQPSSPKPPLPVSATVRFRKGTPSMLWTVPGTPSLAEALETTGCFSEIVDKGSILAPNNAAFSYACLPYDIIVLLPPPARWGWMRWDAIVLYNMLKLSRSDQTGCLWRRGECVPT